MKYIVKQLKQVNQKIINKETILESNLRRESGKLTLTRLKDQ